MVILVLELIETFEPSTASAELKDNLAWLFKAIKRQELVITGPFTPPSCTMLAALAALGDSSASDRCC
jgi:hypothetical protein